MSFWIRLVGGLCVAWLGVFASGCNPSGQDSMSEEKEPHFVLGKSRVNAMDFQGAIEAFNQSLEANPKSAAAHYELGWLYDEKAGDPAAAIYHYQAYLQFNPHADNAEVIKQRIYGCKQKLTAEVQPLSSTPAAQQQLEKLTEQNRQLQDEVARWRAYYANQLAAAKTNAAPGPDDVASSSTGAPTPDPSTDHTAHPPADDDSGRAAGLRPAGSGRTHTVAAGETAMAITRKFKVKLSALRAANPGVNLDHLRVGQVLNLPSS